MIDRDLWVMRRLLLIQVGRYTTCINLATADPSIHEEPSSKASI